MPDRLPPADDLALTALRYAAGELAPAEAAAFEDRLAADQDAREALGEAIRLSAAALHQPAPAPDPLVLEVVRDALRPTLLSWLFPRRPYRGHPLAWAVLGGAVAAALTVFGVWLGDPPTDDPVTPPVAGAAQPAPPDTGPSGLPTAHQYVGTPDPDPLAVAPLPRLVPDDGSAVATVPTPETTDSRTVAADPEESKAARAIPAKPNVGKAALQPDPAPR